MFRDKIKDLMDLQNMTQKELSEKSGITEASISRYLNSERTPRIDIIINFARVFNVSIEYLIDNDDENKELESFVECRTVLARNAKNLTPEEKNDLISILVMQ